MLDNLELEDAGVYICEASNEVGTSQKVFYVNIVDPPKVLSTFENLTLHTNQTASVKCASKGFPVPEIFWTFGDLLNEIKIKDGSEITFNRSPKVQKISGTGNPFDAHLTVEVWFV